MKRICGLVPWRLGWALLGFFLFSFVFVEGVSAATDERAFQAVQEWIETGRRPIDARYSDISLELGHHSIRWQGDKIYQSEFSLYRSRRPSGDPGLNKAFIEYFKQRGWSVSQGISDHYGQTEYRILVTLSKGKSSLSYIFTASNEGGSSFDNWSERLYVLSDKDVVRHPVCADVSFDPFFRHVLLWVRDHKHKISMQRPYFHLDVYSQPVDRDVPQGTVRLKMSFRCEFGPHSTVCGMRCYESLFDAFTAYLKKNRYKVVKVQDYSTPGWTAVVYKAVGPRHTFMFLFSSECAIRMGYASIGIIDSTGARNSNAAD